MALDRVGPGSPQFQPTREFINSVDAGTVPRVGDAFSTLTGTTVKFLTEADKFKLDPADVSKKLPHEGKAVSKRTVHVAAQFLNRAPATPTA